MRAIPPREKTHKELVTEELFREARVRQRLTRATMWFLALAVVLFSGLQIGIVPDRFDDVAARMQFVWGRMWPPVIEDPPMMWDLVVESLEIAVVGTTFGILMSLMLALLAARNVTPILPLSFAVKWFAGFVRAVPALVWALLLIVAVGLGPIAGILTIAINSIGMLTKVYAETIEEIPMGPIEALRASGAKRTHIAFQGILPSIARAFIAWSVFRLDINVRYSTILGVVGAGGIGWELVIASSMGRYDIALGVTLIIFVMVMLTEAMSQWLRNRVDDRTQVRVG